MSNQIAVKVMGVLRRDDKLLVTLDTDRLSGERYARPLGGKIEAGERAIDALRRELREEIGAEIENPRLLGTLENIFTLNGHQRHEIVFIFAAELQRPELYQAPAILRRDRADRTAVWTPLADFRSGAAVLRPAGLLPLVDASAAPA